MDDSLKKDFENAIAFWDSALSVTDEQKKELEESVGEEEWQDMAPSKKIFDAIAEAAKHGRMLDYGCGDGWGALTAAKLGCPDVTAVDMAAKAIEVAKLYMKCFGVDDVVKAEAIDEKWLADQPDESYDAIFCSNVIDVIPLEIAEDILDNAARILKKGGRAVIGMNFYMSPETAKERGLDVKEDRYLFSDGVMRLSLVSDEEWTKILEKRFTVEKLDHFSWPGEEKEGRRLFILSK
ncbi:MAG: class I SAM-dependent methyltransferase [Lachnospiraceae bacterium]|nr:class I SAM-dependent methyltransferase [Lachnospiraceae bacterium]MBR5733793.1 class I SAM-dependent methyltransferase [Lachnospiraceae bacterium]